MSGYVTIAASTSAWHKPFSAKRCASAACSVATRYGPRDRVSVNTPSHGCSRKTEPRNTGAYGASKKASVEGVFRN